jgi:hypothetical protein
VLRRVRASPLHVLSHALLCCALQERRRKRTLLWLREMLGKRVPQAEEALASLDEAVKTLDGNGGALTTAPLAFSPACCR